MFNHKRGSFQDLITIFLVIVVVAVSVLIGFKVNTSMISELNTMPSVPTEAMTAANQLNSYYPGIIDHSFLLLVIGVSLCSIGLASLVKVHPMFIGIFFIGWIVLIILGAVGSNMYFSMASDSNFSTVASQLTFIGQICRYLPFIIGIIGIIIMIVMYKTWTNEATY